MKTSMIKIFSLILIAVMLVSVSNVSLAFDTQGHTGEQINGMNGPGNSGGSLVSGIGGTTTGNTIGKVKGVGNIVIGVIQTIGVVAAIIMLVFLGIKYVSAAPSEKAEIKKSAAIYVVGAVMLLGAAMIIGWVNTFVSDLNTVGTGSASINTTLIHLA